MFSQYISSILRKHGILIVIAFKVNQLKLPSFISWTEWLIIKIEHPNGCSSSSEM